MMKKKFLGIPVLAIICVLVLALTAGIAYAAIGLVPGGGSAYITVTEAIECAGAASAGSWDDDLGIWVFEADELFPNQVETLWLELTNNGPMDVKVTVAVGSALDYSGCDLSMTVGGGPSQTIVVPAGDVATATVHLCTGNSVVPGLYMYFISVTR
ncbi:MAG: hypothetical protein FJ012_04835 [Chloroflexi bacterium]|nr:hypothetical protein [Chloroflexota bacterium]